MYPAEHMDDITIIVPTFNRADFLSRLLAYYARAGFRGQILVGDASGVEQAAMVQKTVEEHRDCLNVHYHPLPGVSIAQTVCVLNGFVQTSFVTLIGDDDFLVTEGLRRCARFLKDHPDYAAANGLGGLMLIEGGKVYGRIQDLGDYPMKGIDAQDPGERLESLLKDYYVPLFSLFRKDVWIHMWPDASNVRDVTFMAELLPNCTGVVMGRIKHLNVLYLIRQGHQRRYTLRDSYDWMTSAEWQPAYMFFYVRLMEVLKAQGVNESNSIRRIKESFWIYLNHCHGKGSSKASHGRAARILRRVSRVLRSLFGRQVSLAKLLSPLNAQHRYFKPIYQLITNHH